MFYKKDKSGYREIAEGVRMKPLVYGSKTLLTEINFDKGSTVDLHSHPHEQTGYLISGHFKLSVEGKSFEVKPGDSWCIPGGVEHKAEFIEDSVAVEVFSPIREEYLPKDIS